MADIDIKAQALSAARNRILQLREQMTDKVLRMVADLGKLIEIIPISDPRAFLKARCNLPTTDLRTSVGFAKALKGSEETVRETSGVVSGNEGACCWPRIQWSS